MPQSVFVGEVMTVTVDLHVSGIEKLPEVTLQVGEEVQRQPIQNQNGRHFAQFNVAVNDAGPQRVTIGVPTTPGEISADNNATARWVKVLSDRFDVLLVGGAASWDFRYLRNALARTHWVNAHG